MSQSCKKMKIVAHKGNDNYGFFYCFWRYPLLLVQRGTYWFTSSQYQLEEEVKKGDRTLELRSLYCSCRRMWASWCQRTIQSGSSRNIKEFYRRKRPIWSSYDFFFESFLTVSWWNNRYHVQIIEIELSEYIIYHFITKCTKIFCISSINMLNAT